MYKLLLILKYLRRRRIAWVSLLAVTLCTAMVIVVISVMGGWLQMYERNARGMTGDLVVKGAGLSGFAHYEEMAGRIRRLPYVEAAVPQIKTLGVATIGQQAIDPRGREYEKGLKTEGVQVYGVQIDQIGKVNNWPNTLWHQHVKYLEQNPPQVPPAAKTFNVPRVVTVRLGLPLTELPPPLRPGFAGERGPEWANIVYNRATGELETDRPISGEQRRALADHGKGEDWGKIWESAVLKLTALSNQRGLVAGSRLLEISRDKKGDWTGRDAFKYTDLWAKVTVAGVSDTETIDMEARSDRVYWIIDDSRTGMWQYDNNSVYVPFEVLQTDLGMESREVELAGTGEKARTPARTTELQIKCRQGTNLEAVKPEVAAIVRDVLAAHRNDPAPGPQGRPPRVETWREASATYLAAIEKEKMLMVFLFAIISLVAVFLIFCIFYMIVAEKTKDIGIVKSMGATNSGVAGIFLGYGLAIGIVGAGAGLLLSYLIVKYINEIHDWLGSTFRLVVWNPEVYAFDTIPNQVDPPTVAVILTVAVLASVLGALVPAVRAARMHPVEALRWE